MHCYYFQLIWEGSMFLIIVDSYSLKWDINIVIS